jgi:hypothetical protein
VSSIRRCELPPQALHKRYEAECSYVDCYSTVVQGSVSHPQFVEAFYTTLLFKLERFILFLFLSKSSSDEEARRLASGSLNSFAAWTVEARAENQLLMCDFKSSTRSWLMVDGEEDSGDIVTRLYFGSVVVHTLDKNTGKRKMGFLLKALMPFHRLYSHGLLAAAKFRLRNAAAPTMNANR